MTPLRASVLIVDDDPAKLLALTAALAPMDVDVVQVTSGLEALRVLLTRDFSVILLDVRMPDMSGFETAELIRRRRQTESTPIIFITAYARDEVESGTNYAHGAADFIYAPVSPEELRAKVSVFADLHARSEALVDQARVLRAAADQFRLVADVAPIGIFQTDAEDRYVYTNPCWSATTGIAAEDALGTVWGSTIKPTTADGAAVRLADTDVARADVRVEIELAGGERRTLVATSAVVRDAAGRMSGRVGTVADVTAETLVEAALSEARDKANEASALKSDFLANMSHEIRTPMNGVIGMTDLLLETDLDTTQRDYAQTVRNSGEALLAIINDILDFSKIEAGKVDVEVVEFNVRSIVHDVVQLLRGGAETKGLELQAAVDAAVPAVVRGDPGRLRQVLTNLVGNSVKFTHHGRVDVRVSREDDQAGTGLRFEVTDTGVGIAADGLDAIFEPFVQGDTSTSRKFGGTGLGLAISAQLVALMGGICGVSSSLGSGSAFWFTVVVQSPRERARSLTHAVADAGCHPSRSPRHGRVLLAEDNAVNEKVARAMLVSAGHEVDAVRNGADAVAALKHKTYDVVLMDCQMPELNGYEATQLIRAYEGTGRHVPIIAMTAGARTEDRDRCFAAGMDDYIAKPVSKDALVAIVSHWLSVGSPPSGGSRVDNDPLPVGRGARAGG